MNGRTFHVLSIPLLAALVLLPSPVDAVERSKAKVTAEPRDDRALVYFIRAPSWGRGVDSTLYIYADDEFVAAVQKNSYTFTYLEPGARFLWNSASARERAAADPTSTREVKLEAGQEYYIAISYLLPPHVSFATVSRQDGATLLRETKLYVTADAKDTAEATHQLEERLFWLKEVDRRREQPEAEVWRMPDEDSQRALCSLKKIYVDEIKISATGGMKTVSSADTFRRSLRQRLAKLGLEPVGRREDADAVLEGTVGKNRVDTARSYKRVSSARVSLRTLEGQEIWNTEVDNFQTNPSTNAFNIWSQLAKRAANQLVDQCKQVEP